MGEWDILKPGMACLVSDLGVDVLGLSFRWVGLLFQRKRHHISDRSVSSTACAAFLEPLHFLVYVLSFPAGPSSSL